jgi:hypothetical protein
VIREITVAQFNKEALMRDEALKPKVPNLVFTRKSGLPRIAYLFVFPKMRDSQVQT